MVWITYNEILVKKTDSDPGSTVEIKGTVTVDGVSQNFENDNIREDTSFDPPQQVYHSDIATTGRPNSITVSLTEVDSSSPDDDIGFLRLDGGAFQIETANMIDVEFGNSPWKVILRYRVYRG